MRYVNAPQQQDPMGLFRPLMRVLSRRGLDHHFLPQVIPPLGNRDMSTSFQYLLEKITALTEAILGEHIDYKSANRSAGRVARFPRNAPLPPALGQHLFSTMAEMETEAIILGRNIEMNNFRRARNDPRAQDEEHLRALRNDALQRWTILADQLLKEVNTFWDVERRKMGSSRL